MNMKSIVLVFLVFTALLLSSCLTENGCKEYIINHKQDIVKIDSGYYKIDKPTSMSYYTDVTIIRKDLDSAYRVVFWGDRESWLWNVLLDKYFNVDIPYSRSKGKDVELDKQVLGVLKNK